MQFTMQHYARIPISHSSLLSPEAWDELRASSDPAYLVPGQREAWLQSVSRVVGLREEAADIIRLAEGRTIISVGCGRAAVEWHIKNLAPEQKLICADFATQAVERLRCVFHEADEVRKYDLLKDTWPDDALILLYRVDAELDNAQWTSVYERLKGRVVFVPCGLLTPSSFLRALRRTLSRHFQKYAFAGYLRTESTFVRLWAGWNWRRIAVGSRRAYLLTR